MNTNTIDPRPCFIAEPGSTAGRFRMYRYARATRRGGSSQGADRMLDFALALLTGIVIAAASSWITVQLSLRRFRTERWWEKKAEAYERIIAALHDAKAFADAYFEGQGRIADDDEVELRKRSKIASEEIARAIDVGSFLLSAEALARLKEYTRERGKHPNRTVGPTTSMRSGERRTIA